MRKLMIVLAMSLGSQAIAQEAPKSILEFTNLNAESEVTIPIPNDTMVYVFAPVSILDLNIDPVRVVKDPEGVFSFYEFGNLSIMEARRNDSRVRFSVIRN